MHFLVAIKIHFIKIHIFEKILNHYDFLREYFRNSDDAINYTQAISISDDSIDIQTGLDIRICENTEEFSFAPKCLCINIPRIALETQMLSCKETKNFV